ncbi:nodulation receptor kinase-like [Tasmannia lanceolata]|uniref:nodulation receptor kinase-like n=1 Tax=Tasmannia lanceolata TaxID=3420 RepID=UPI004063043A
MLRFAASEVLLVIFVRWKWKWRAVDKMALVNLGGLGCLLCLFFHVTYAQEGFVSLECCSPSNWTDPYTKINWTSDIDVFQHQGRCRLVTLPELNDTNYNEARIFSIDSGNKWCYNLTTIREHDYLIRGTFLHGPSLRTSTDVFFDVLIGTTKITQVNSSVDDLEVEGVFRATNGYINFCLVAGKGDSYISKLELRPLNDSLYLKENSSVILKVVSRVDLGNTAHAIRYPQDPNDRIWTVDASSNKPLINNVSIYGANTSVPMEVLQSAATNVERLQFVHADVNTKASVHDYLVFLYLLELNSSIKTGQRVFDIYVNGEKFYEKFDILQNTTSNYREAVLKVNSTDGYLNISLIKASANVTELGPICNAYEIFQVHKRAAETLQVDVDKIVGVRNEFLVENPGNVVLGSWSGDPCLPSTWKGLGCEHNNGGSVITKLDLSSNGLQGFLPPIIGDLKELTEINVRDNNITGSIPESFSLLRHLTNLSFGCNPLLNNHLPADLSHRSNLTTDFGRCANEDPSGPQLRLSSYAIGSVAGGSILFTVALGIIFTCVYRHVKYPVSTKSLVAKNAIFALPSMDDIDLKPILIQAFSLESIETATCKYKTMIGEGGFGAVYRGTLPHAQEVAVKVRSATSTQGTREFENELNLLSAIRHENLVPLLGYCCEKDQQILVYPFMSNGSLQDRLYGEAAKRKSLDWQTRLSIALGAAQGLMYLHTFAERCVIHRDVKSSNILLDHSMCAKVADFGFSKYAPQEGDSGVSLEVRGTAGYLDPEYYSTQHLSAKSDVFSFGVVLLEIITGREPLDLQRPRNEWSLVEWATPFIRDGRIEEIADPSIKSGYHVEAMYRVVEVALECIELYSASRPCMVDIVRELEHALIIEINASEYMRSIESMGGSNRFISLERKVVATTPTVSEPSPIFSQQIAPPQPR